MLLCADVGSADADLASGAIACPSCGGRLGPWGHGRERAVRLHYGERAVVRPPRGRCRACRATHMLLPSWMAPRRADGAGEFSLSLGQGYSFHGPEVDEALALVELGEFARRG